MAKKVNPHLKAYSSCVKELGLNPRTIKANRGKLKACAIGKLKKMGIKSK